MSFQNQIALREIQHYVYCKRRWSLLHIEGSWAQNDKVIEGDITHKQVNDPFFNEKRVNKHLSRAVPVYCDKYDIFGVVDCLEFEKDDSGIEISGHIGHYKINIIEYKNSKPKFFKEADFADLMQVTGQALCVMEMFGIMPIVYLYFADTRHRHETVIDKQTILQFLKIIDEIRESKEKAVIFDIPENQHCSNCSMSDYCLPETNKRIESVFTRIKKSQSKELV